MRSENSARPKLGEPFVGHPGRWLLDTFDPAAWELLVRGHRTQRDPSQRQTRVWLAGSPARSVPQLAVWPPAADSCRHLEPAMPLLSLHCPRSIMHALHIFGVAMQACR
jgi:hypothetical protein